VKIVQSMWTNARLCRVKTQAFVASVWTATSAIAPEAIPGLIAKSTLMSALHHYVYGRPSASM